MIPEIAEYALILGLCMALLLGTVPLWGAIRRDQFSCRLAGPLAVGLFLFVLFSFLCLMWSFYSNDFSVVYVANNSNASLPWYYRLCAVWGGHEGSLLLWLLILTGWTLAVALRSGNLPTEIRATVLAVMGLVAVGFTLFILLTSSPFERYLPRFPSEGADLNPLLQDPGMIVHPPMLYMGYVGFSVAFAFAIAALVSGRLDTAWARWSRPWTTTAWAFLTLGIALGSWWSYYELGWGGWWFWDPVENASLMPWLVGTALMHSLAVTEKRGVFKSWTVLLAIFAFSLSLVGTFLVRSGVLTSVHAFASDPRRGLFILILLAITIGASLLLYALRAGNVKSESSFSWLSRESLMLVNNVVLTVSCATVLLGTLYPLLVDALDLGKISVGPPYFNMLFVPLMVLLMASMGIGVLCRWRTTSGKQLLQALWLPGVLAVVLGIGSVMLFDGKAEVWTFVGMVMAFWVLLAGCRELFQRVSNKKQKLLALGKQPRGYYGMHLAHLGVVVAAVGVALTSTFSLERNLRIEPGQSVEFGQYQVKFADISAYQGPNFRADRIHLAITQDGQSVADLYPEKRLYSVRRNMMSEASIDPGLFRDLYAAVGEKLDGKAWAVRMQYKPFVRWIWLGGLLMLGGGLLAATDPRYRRMRKRDQASGKQTDKQADADDGRPVENL